MSHSFWGCGSTSRPKHDKRPPHVGGLFHFSIRTDALSAASWCPRVWQVHCPASSTPTHLRGPRWRSYDGSATRRLIEQLSFNRCPLHSPGNFKSWRAVAPVLREPPHIFQKPSDEISGRFLQS